jgi:hypothetical protein
MMNGGMWLASIGMILFIIVAVVGLAALIKYFQRRQ